ncbi:muconolactone Delta-isomerase [Nesterenkonia flava]|uniref:Muconolactone Delta-isomerase n=1 Tax=Nesterenkonia flava TaxID=469799 RepID=A0ABU1FPM2_9MICC|nr:muconolactone Delta-isomerase family protein [Nesterenkonia flava]MDR5710593.1 muconolactone Delta-isomerase family protein [Nesterenkonia flava]
MEFLVRFETRLPESLSSEQVAELKAAERERAVQLRQSGILKKLWRVPGRRATVGLWEADDATVLHEALASLPQFPWMDVEVEPLATHPQEK